MSPAKSKPAACTQAEFARLQGWSPAYVTKLKKAGRLVLLPDGSVAVNQSVERIAQTAEGGAGKTARHRSEAPQDEPEAPKSDKDRQAFYAAELARLDFEERVGTLVLAAGVRDAVAGAITTMRTTMEQWPETAAEDLARLGADVDVIRAHLSNMVDELLDRLHMAFQSTGSPKPRGEGGAASPDSSEQKQAADGPSAEPEGGAS